MPTKLGIFFLGMTIGGATFLATGLAAFLTISQIQYGTLQARATRVTEIDQVSVRAKDIPVVIGTEADVRYAQLPPEWYTWAMMLLGFAGLGFVFRQSRRNVSMAWLN